MRTSHGEVRSWIVIALRVVRVPDVFGEILGPVVRRGQVIKWAAGGAMMAGGTKLINTDNGGRIQTNVSSGVNDAIASSSRRVSTIRVPPPTHRWVAQLLIAEHIALA